MGVVAASGSQFALPLSALSLSFCMLCVSLPPLVFSCVALIYCKTDVQPSQQFAADEPAQFREAAGALVAMFDAQKQQPMVTTISFCTLGTPMALPE